MDYAFPGVFSQSFFRMVTPAMPHLAKSTCGRVVAISSLKHTRFEVTFRFSQHLPPAKNWHRGIITIARHSNQ
ncbi:MAG: hypothetical protein CM1200mP18_04170 [Gammaproteobacteria bacterium]|nr:MAG: hypothetical protein CM1200mP18_04170 [Gammaproteobacteria bacterium]